MNKLTIHYAPGPAVGDFELEPLYQYMLTELENNDAAIVCSSELFFTRVRVGVHEGDIPHDSVRFVWRGEEFMPDKNGRLDRWLDGFLDTHDKLLERLL